MLGNVSKVTVNGFERVEDISQFDEHFTKSHNEENNEGYFIKVDVQYSEKLNDLYDDLPFERLKKLKCLFPVYMIKLNISFKWEI